MHTKAAQLSYLNMILLGAGVGIMSGICAFVFRLLINMIRNIAFHTHESLVLPDAMHHTPLLQYGILIILIPILGALTVTFLVTHISKESRGHGVPEVVYAIHFKKGIISPMVAFIKVLASALTIGTGGSAGREGPIIQIGASLGSTLGQIIFMPATQRIVLIAAGAGSGIAATFGAPLTGLVFAIELMLVTVNIENIVIIVIAIVSASSVSYLIFGNAPDFLVHSSNMNADTLDYFKMIFSLLPFSALVGIASYSFIYSMNKAETLFEKYFHNPYYRHVTGMALVGLMLYVLAINTGHYYVLGVGYATINDLFQLTLTDPRLLLIICACKMIATCLTLGSGGSGGLFSPALFIGATLGAAYAAVLDHFFPGHAHTVVFIIAGMAGLVSGSTGLMVTAIFLGFEITRDFSAIIPIMMVVTLSTAITAKLCSKNIFSMHAARKGFDIPYNLQR